MGTIKDIRMIPTGGVIFLLLLTLALVSLYLVRKEGFGFYYNFFNVGRNPWEPPVRATARLRGCEQSKNILVEFPPEASRENMVAFIANIFRQNYRSQNIVDMRLIRQGGGSQFYNKEIRSQNGMFPNQLLESTNNRDSEYDSATLRISEITTQNYSISSPSVVETIEIPIHFLSGGRVLVQLDRVQKNNPLAFFLHHYFDPFYATGRLESSMTEKWTGRPYSEYDHLVRVNDLSDCQWSNPGRSNIPLTVNLDTVPHGTPRDFAVENLSCPVYQEPEMKEEPITVEPDTDKHTRAYKTPSQRRGDLCASRDIHFRIWDGRGVFLRTLEETQQGRQFISHPALFETSKNGLYDGMFGLQTGIPDIPTGKAVNGR